MFISEFQNNAFVRYRERIFKEKTEGNGENPYESKGALLYMFCRRVVRPAEAITQTTECLAIFASLAFRTRVPLAPLCGYPNYKNEKEKLV